MPFPCLTHENLSYVHLPIPLPQLLPFLWLDEEKHKDLASHVSKIAEPHDGRSLESLITT